MLRFPLITSALLATFVLIASHFLSRRPANPLERRTAQAQSAPPAFPAQGASKAASLLSTQKPPVRFRDIATQAGLTTVPHSRSDRRYVLDTMAGGGIALFDCDNDGKLDIAVVNDSTIDRYLNGGDQLVTLYHQDGSLDNLRFSDITKEAGLTTRSWGIAIAVGDFDNDGLPDLYITGFGRNVLYRNL